MAVSLTKKTRDDLKIEDKLSSARGTLSAPN